MSEMAPEALVPDIWRCEPARCTNCGGPWHAGQRGGCETSCLAGTVIHAHPQIPPNITLGDN